MSKVTLQRSLMNAALCPACRAVHGALSVHKSMSLKYEPSSDERRVAPRLRQVGGVRGFDAFGVQNCLVRVYGLWYRRRVVPRLPCGRWSV